MMHHHFIACPLLIEQILCSAKPVLYAQLHMIPDNGLHMYMLPFLSMISFIFITSSVTVQYNSIVGKY